MENTNNQGLKGLYGSIINPARNVGYCKKHRCYLTATTLKQRRCLGKQCHALDKNLSHDYWRQYEQRKAWRKARKNAIKGVAQVA